MVKLSDRFGFPFIGGAFLHRFQIVGAALRLVERDQRFASWFSIDAVNTVRRLADDRVTGQSGGSRFTCIRQDVQPVDG